MAKWFVFVLGLLKHGQLGSMFTRNGMIDDDVERRVNAGNKVNGALRSVVGSQFWLYTMECCYTLIKITPNKERHLNALARLPSDPAGGLDFLKRSYRLNDTTDVLVSPNKKRFLEDFARRNGMPVEFKHNYARTFESVEYGPGRQGPLGFDLFGYNSYKTIVDNIADLAKKAPELVTIQHLGKSYQGRPIQLIKISSDLSANHPIIFIDAGIHAREWVAPAMAMYLVHRLVHDPVARSQELNGVDWYIMPVVNPDGYEYSRRNRSTRLWRKTRSKTKNNQCFGVDGNRNYAYEWGVSGVSFNPCMDNYSGNEPFSEIETKLVRTVMENSPRIKLYVSLHTYGQYLVYPWGYTGKSLPKQWRRLHTLAEMVSDSVQRAGGAPFAVMSAGEWYPAAGASDDYALGRVGIPYSYTMELTEGFEFTFPKQLLNIVLPQYYEGFKTFSVQIKQEFTDTSPNKHRMKG